MALHVVTGETVFMSENVHTDLIVSVLYSTDRKTFVTIAKDMLIQTWSIESLAKAHIIRLKGFYVDNMPKFAAINTSRFALVMEDVENGTFPVVIYDADTKETFNHAPEVDHVGVVTAVTSNIALRCFATAALDGRVKIWTELNELLVELNLGDPITACTFLNAHGNLGIGVQYAALLSRGTVARVASRGPRATRVCFT